MARYLHDPKKAAAILRFSGIIAYPTEAVYGIGCVPTDGNVVQRLLRIKRRPPEQGLILIAAEISQLMPWLEPLPADIETSVLASWPGPVTWLWPAKPKTPSYLTGKHKTLAVRVTDHPLARALCEHTGSAIISTSANRTGEIPARTADAVNSILGDELDAILDGSLGSLEQPTQIRDALTGEVIRSS